MGSKVFGPVFVWIYCVWLGSSALKASATVKKPRSSSCFWCGSSSKSNNPVATDPPLCRSCQVQLNRVPRETLIHVIAYVAGYNSIAFRIMAEGNSAIQEFTDIMGLPAKSALKQKEPTPVSRKERVPRSGRSRVA